MLLTITLWPTAADPTWSVPKFTADEDRLNFATPPFAAACVTVRVWPSIVIVPVRAVEALFAAAL